MVHRYRLSGDRELRTARSHGRIFIAVHDLSGTCTGGPFAVRENELDSLRSALADLAGETGFDGGDVHAPASEAGRSPRAGAGGVRR